MLVAGSAVTGDDRKHILARRAKFIAAALATVGMGVVACKPETCLTPTAVPDEMKTKTSDAGVAEPNDEKGDAAVAEDAHWSKACLSMSMPRAREAGPIPISCLSVLYDPDGGPPPMPCLSPPRGPKGDSEF
jgi:hypothetical protein